MIKHLDKSESAAKLTTEFGIWKAAVMIVNRPILKLKSFLKIHLLVL